MGVLSAFALGMATFATERILSAENGLLHDIGCKGRDRVVAGAIAAVLAALFFYRQRSHLAWYYGQIALAESRGPKSPHSVEDWLTDADGWGAWVLYQTGFIILSLSLSFYCFAACEALKLVDPIAPLWSIWLPSLLVLVLIVVRWFFLTKYSQEDDPWANLRTHK